MKYTNLLLIISCIILALFLIAAQPIKSNQEDASETIKNSSSFDLSNESSAPDKNNKRTKGLTISEQLNRAVRIRPIEEARKEIKRIFAEVRKVPQNQVRADKDLEREESERVNKQTITEDEAISIALKEHPGEILELEIEDGLYEVKVISREGKKYKLYIDPKDGHIVRKR